jgi:hypothetical protein
LLLYFIHDTMTPNKLVLLPHKRSFMANTHAGGEIPQPIERRADEMVMSVYPSDAARAVPDTGSVALAETYLTERFEEESLRQRTRVVGVDTSIRMPKLVREPAGTKVVPRLRSLDRWAIRPAVAALASLASFGGLAIGSHGFEPGENAAQIGRALDQTGQVAGHKIYRIFYPVKDRIVSSTEPGKLIIVSDNAQSANKIGEFVVNTSAIDSFVTEVNQAVRSGDTLETLHVQAGTSDEFGSDGSIGQTDPGNATLGQARASAAEAALQSSFRSAAPDNVTISIGTREAVISAKQKATLEAAAQNAGFDNLYDAIQAADNGKPMNAGLLDQIKSVFDSKRGVVVTATLETHGKPVIEKHTVKGADNPPKKPDWHLLPFIPILPFKRFRGVQVERPAHKWRFIPMDVIRRPKLIVESLENAWVRLRPEAMNDDRTLGPNPWAFARKYEHLFRDDRIFRVLRADFKNSQEQERSMRIMFVDHVPDKETVKLFTDALSRFTVIQGGALAEKISGIFVFPERNTGLDPKRPKRIGIGVDKQSPEGVLGTCTPILELVEMHMDDKCKPSDIVAMLQEFGGPYWTLAHEVAGHGSDIAERKPPLVPVTSDIPNAHIIKGDSWRQVMKPLDNLRRLHTWSDRINILKKPIEFDITYGVPDLDGKMVQLKARVTEEDPRMDHATSAVIVGHRNTQYAGEDQAEHLAETVASDFTGILAPFHEADVAIDDLVTVEGGIARFTPGYQPDVHAQALTNRNLSAYPDRFPTEFKNQPNASVSLIDPKNDPLLREQMIRARNIPFPEPDQLIAILARVRQAQRRK